MNDSDKQLYSNCAERELHGYAGALTSAVTEYQNLIRKSGRLNFSVLFANATIAALNIAAIALLAFKGAHWHHFIFPIIVIVISACSTYLSQLKQERRYQEIIPKLFSLIHEGRADHKLKLIEKDIIENNADEEARAEEYITLSRETIKSYKNFQEARQSIKETSIKSN